MKDKKIENMNGTESMREEGEELRIILEKIAVKYAKLVEERIDNIEDGLTGIDLREVYEGIQMLGHIMATLERFNRMEKLE